MSTETYNIWALIFQALFGFGTVATLFYMRLQLKQMQKASEGQHLLSLVEWVQSSHIREARTVVRQTLRNKKFDAWTAEEKRSADVVCANYDVLAVLLLEHKLAPEETFLKNWGPSIRDCHDILKDYIHHQQSPSKSGQAYWRHFAELRSRCDLHAN